MSKLFVRKAYIRKTIRKSIILFSRTCISEHAKFKRSSRRRFNLELICVKSKIRKFEALDNFHR